MATPGARKRKAAVPQVERTVKTSLILAAGLHTKLAAAAAMRGVDRNALVVEILTEALRGVIIHGWEKFPGRFTDSDRPNGGGVVSLDDEDEAA
jgi:hypothetical protein